jgi:hypothetical protein
LIEQAPAQFLERDHDVIAKRGALRKRAIPALDLRKRRTLELQFEIPVQRCPGGDVGQGQRVSEQKRLNELRRPQTFSILALDGVSKLASIGS